MLYGSGCSPGHPVVALLVILVPLQLPIPSSTPALLPEYAHTLLGGLPLCSHETRESLPEACEEMDGGTPWPGRAHLLSFITIVSKSKIKQGEEDDKVKVNVSYRQDQQYFLKSTL